MGDVLLPVRRMPSTSSRSGYSCLSTTSQLVKKGSAPDLDGWSFRPARRIFAHMSPYEPCRLRTESMGVSHSRTASRKGGMATGDERQGAAERETVDSAGWLLSRLDYFNSLVCTYAVRGSWTTSWRRYRTPPPRLRSYRVPSTVKQSAFSRSRRRKWR